MCSKPPLDVLCAMKFSAVLARAKGRDFYDLMFLMSKTSPNLDFLRVKNGISTMEQLKQAVQSRLESVDLNQKKRDFTHLVFNEANADRILHFQDCLK